MSVDEGPQSHDVLVIGHRQPDTDSIASAIGYAEFLRRTAGGQYIPCCCGELNAEALFALEASGASAPRYIESVEPTVSDLPYLESRSVPPELPTIDTVLLMDRYGMRNMPVTDAEGHLLGLISEYGLARAYVRGERNEQLSLVPVTVPTLARILDAAVIHDAGEPISGRVYTKIDALHVALSKLSPKDVAIVGDDEPAQLALVAAGIAAIIVANGAPVGDRVATAAKSRGVSILSSPLDAFSVAKLCGLSLPVSMVMETDVPVVRMDETLAYAKQLISQSRFRTACVVDQGGRFIGQISRSALMEDVQKRVILVDHNEPDQAVEGIEKAEILEIIDHHRIAAITTLKPVKFLNDPLGSTSTIITRKFMDAGIEPTRESATMLLSGILSDTLVLKMSTTTPEDTRAVAYLAHISGRDPLEYGRELVRRGMVPEGVPLSEVLTRDMKRYRLSGREIVISQVMLPSFEFSQRNAPEIRREVNRQRERFQADLFIALFTSVFDEASEVYASAEEGVLKRLGFQTQPVYMEKVMSRKKEFLPRLGEMLREI